MNDEKVNLYMIIIGCRPEGRHIEQHDVYFGAGDTLPSMIPALKAFWPDGGTLHIDSWRKVTMVDGFRVRLAERNSSSPDTGSNKLFFINLGGYKPGDLEEYHYKMLMVAADKGEAISRSKKTAFYQHTGFKGAESHIDDKYGVDVDDVYAIEDILPAVVKERYSIILEKTAAPIEEDELHIGYVNLSKLK